MYAIIPSWLKIDYQYYGASAGCRDLLATEGDLEYQVS